MAMTYTTLTGTVDTEGSIRYFVRHSLVPSEFILERAQEAIFSMLRVQEMMTRSTGTIAEDATTIAFPSDCLHPLALFRTGLYKGQIDILDYQHFEQIVGEDEDGELYSGTPARCTFDKTSFYLDAKADQAYPYRLWYMARLANLAATTNETNALTTKYGHILEAMCKHYAYAHRENDGQAQQWLAKANGYIQAANMQFDEWWQQIRAEAYWSR